MSTPVPVTFLPAGVTVWADPGSTVVQCATSAGIVLPAPCGGRGVCGRCGVRVVDGTLAEPDAEELLGTKNAPAGIRLACRARIAGAVTIRPLLGSPVPASAPAESGTEGVIVGFDLGTTTVSAVIVSAASGRELGRASVPNRQLNYGGDVLSRVSAALAGDAVGLRQAALDSLRDALSAACSRANECASSVERAAVAGNSVMTALLLGEDVTSLAAHPFTIAASWRSTRADAEISESLGIRVPVVVAPSIAAFVGGDLAVGLVAAGLGCDADDSVMLDLGTNAEIAVWHGGRLSVASAAAGPAFEGFGISNGGAAAPGAVTGVRAEGGTLHVDVMGGGEPVWICGAGLVSVLAELLRSRHLDADGRMSAAGPYADRFSMVGDVLACGLGPGGSAPHVLQTDVRAFQSAKAAVAAGLLISLDRAGLDPGDLGSLVVAGGFGAALRVDDTLELGILPSDAASRVSVIGDAALSGAAMLAIQPLLSEELDALAGGAHHLDLASDQEFAQEYLSALRLAPYSMAHGFAR